MLIPAAANEMQENLSAAFIEQRKNDGLDMFRINIIFPRLNHDRNVPVH